MSLRHAIFVLIPLVMASVTKAAATDYVIGASNAKDSDRVYLRVGIVQDDGIDWGNETRMNGKAKGPVFATDEGVAVMVFSKDKEIAYRVGEVQTATLTIDWGPVNAYGPGRDPMVAMAGSKVVIAYKGPNKDVVFTATGRANGPRKQVVWEDRVLYDERGRNPVVAAGSESEATATLDAEVATGEPASADDAALATLVINTHPSNAEVTLDARYLGQSPVSVSVEPTEAHTIQIYMEGYTDAVKIIEANTLTPGASEPLLLRLRAK